MLIQLIFYSFVFFTHSAVSMASVSRAETPVVNCHIADDDVSVHMKVPKSSKQQHKTKALYDYYNSHYH